MSHTSRLVTLLGRFRRERNGLVADTMHYDGKRYGLNYGVSLATVRRIVSEEPRDHAFARYLYGQDVRCLQLAALHLADPDRLAEAAEAAFWFEGLHNSELAEEAAFALLAHCRGIENLLPDTPLGTYALLMAAVRSTSPGSTWIARSLDYLRHTAADEQAPSYALRLLLRATTALWGRLIECSAASRSAVGEQLDRLGDTPWEQYLVEELRWRFDYQ